MSGGHKTPTKKPPLSGWFFCCLTTQKHHSLKSGVFAYCLILFTHMKALMKWSLLLTGFMPVIYSADSLFPFIFPKALFFRCLVFLSTVFFCIACGIDSKYRNDIIQKVKNYWKHSVFKVMALLHASLLISTIFAYDQYMAMFGNIERSEGFVGLLFFYIFFVLTVLVFEKKDWLRFFAVNIITGGLLFFVELNQSMFQGNVRPGSLTDNPIFLATYQVFVLFCSVIIYRLASQKKNLLIMIASVFSVVISIIGIFITQTRGTILGMVAAMLVVLVYFGFKGKNFTIIKGLTSRKLTVIALVLFGIFIAIFISTRHADVWKHVPVVGRIAQISTKDGDTQARVVNATIVFAAVNPKEASVTRSLFGWGWDNYVYAWQKFYNPKLYSADPSLFDRAHDKALDMLLMAGFIGLFLYFAVWFFFFKEAFKAGKNFTIETSLFIFWGITYFLQNMTVFDTMVTFITFYAVFAYLVYETRENTTKVIAK